MVKKLMKLFAEMGFILTKMEGVNERVFERQIVIPHPEKKNTRLRIPAWVRIYSSIEGSELRTTGEDAIRIQAVRKWSGPAEEKILYQATRVNRTGEDTLEDRIRERARECWREGANKRNCVRPSLEAKLKAENGGQDAPSEKQKAFYKKLTGNDFPAGFSRKQASEAIDAAMRAKGMPVKTQTNGKGGKRRWIRKDSGFDPNLATPAQWGFLSKLTGQTLPQSVPERLSKPTKATVSTWIETAKKEYDNAKIRLSTEKSQQAAWFALNEFWQAQKEKVTA